MKNFCWVKYKEKTLIVALLVLGFSVVAPSHAQNLVVNGGFETGDFTGWTVYSSNLDPFEVHPDLAHTPSAYGAGIISILEESYIYLYQDIPLPDSNIIILTYWDWVRDGRWAEDPNYAQNYQVQIRDTNNVILETLFDADRDIAPDNWDWTEHTYDLSAYAGQTIRLFFNLPIDHHALAIRIDDIDITVGDETPPNISSRAFTYEEGTTGHFLRWTMEDAHPGTYELYMDLVWVQGDSWTSGETIEYNIDGLAVGPYEFTLVICDDPDIGPVNCITDTVYVTVYPSQDPGPTPAPLFPNVLRMLPLAILAGAFVVLRRRRKHPPAN